MLAAGVLVALDRWRLQQQQPGHDSGDPELLYAQAGTTGPPGSYAIGPEMATVTVLALWDLKMGVLFLGMKADLIRWISASPTYVPEYVAAHLAYSAAGAVDTVMVDG